MSFRHSWGSFDAYPPARAVDDVRAPWVGALAMLDPLPHPVAVLDADGQVVHVNPAWAATMRPPDGVAAPEPGSTLSDTLGWAFGSSSSSALVEGVRRVAAGIAPAFEAPVPDGIRGITRPARIHVAPTASGDGSVVVTVLGGAPPEPDSRATVAADPSATAPSLDPLRGGTDLANRYRVLWEESPIGFFSCAPDGRYLNANPAFLRMLGCASLDELRAAVLPLSRGADSHPILLVEDPVENDGVAADRELEIVRPDGRSVVLRLWLRPVTRVDGDLECVEGAAEDITERRALERRLLEAQKLEAIGQLAGGVAHDFNNVLTVILAEAQLALLGSGPGNDVSEHLRDIENAARSGSMVTRQLLLFARRDRSDVTVVELGQAILGVQRLVSRLIGERVEVSLTLASDPLPVLIDRGRLDQVILNLAVNARDAMPSGGTLSIGTRIVPGPEARAQITVSDTGVGMSEAVRQRAFEPFFTTKARGKGTGLGLAAVYGIVKDAGGDVEIESAPGSGTSVRIVLPLAEVTGEEEAPQVSPAHPGGARVLLVEDDDEVRRSISRVLRAAGFEVIEASDGARALSATEAPGCRVDLLVADVGLPDVPGPTLAERILEARPGLPVVFISGYPEADPPSERGARRVEGVLLSKPFTFEELAEAMAVALSRGGAGEIRTGPAAPR